VLSLLIAATGLFMASIQLSIGTLYNTYPNAGKFRAGLTLLGLVLVAASLFFTVWPLIDSTWLWIPLGALMLGGLVPVIWIIRLKLPYWRFIRRLFRTSLRPLPSGWCLEGQSGDYETGIVWTSESGENRVAGSERGLWASRSIPGPWCRASPPPATAAKGYGSAAWCGLGGSRTEEGSGYVSADLVEPSWRR
jgi:hypothetical protein